MKGLLMKDFYLTMVDHRLLLGCCFLVICFLPSGMSEVLPMVYITTFFSMMTISTISYDGWENGMGPLMTFPITRKQYAVEKYIFGVLLTGAGCGLFLVTQCVVGVVQSRNVSYGHLLFSSLIVACCIYIVLAIMIPLMIKYGPEKGRVVGLIVAAVVMVGVFGSTYLLESSGNSELKTALVKLFSWMEHISMSDGLILAIVGACAAVVTAFSVAASCHVMERKEF